MDHVATGGMEAENDSWAVVDRVEAECEPWGYDMSATKAMKRQTSRGEIARM